MTKRKTLIEIREAVKNVHGDIYTIPDQDYKGMHSYISVIDKDFGEGRVEVANLIKGQNIKKRASFNRAISKRAKIENVLGMLNNMIDMDITTYKGTHKKARFIDKEYGEFWATPNVILNKNSNGRHPNFYKDKRKTLHILPIETIIKRLKEKWGDEVSIKKDTYKGMRKKATFTHIIYGDWNAMVYSVLNGHGNPKGRTDKFERTSMERYGVPYPSQLPEISIKSSKGSNARKIKYHWENNSQIICVGGYECSVVDYLNENKIKFLWQPKSFETNILTNSGKKRYYTPDMYLVDTNTWVEIKGYFREDAKDKWDWFVLNYPNSELWDYNKLRKMRIL